MRHAILLMLLGLVVSGCEGSLPRAPDVDFCFGIHTGRLESAYAFCRGWLTPGRERRVPAAEVFSSKYFMMSVGDYERIINYTRALESVARERCR